LRLLPRDSFKQKDGEEDGITEKSGEEDEGLELRVDNERLYIFVNFQKRPSLSCDGREMSLSISRPRARAVLQSGDRVKNSRSVFFARSSVVE